MGNKQKLIFLCKEEYSKSLPVLIFEQPLQEIREVGVAFHQTEFLTYLAAVFVVATEIGISLDLLTFHTYGIQATEIYFVILDSLLFKVCKEVWVVLF